MPEPTPTTPATPATTPSPAPAATTPSVASPTPAEPATPATPVAAPASAPANEEPTSDGMKGFLDDSGREDEGESDDESQAESTTATEPAPGEVPAATPPTTPVPTPPTPEVPPTPSAAQPATPTPETQPQPELSPEQVTERFKQWRSEGVTLLAEQHYNIAPEQVKEIVDPETGMVNAEKLAKTVSRTAAQVYMDVVTAAMGQMTQHLPALIERVLNARTQSASMEGKFFEQWPQLKGHRDVVLRLGSVYRRDHPRATVDDFIKEVGATAMVALRMGIPAAPATPTPQVAGKPFRPAAASRPATPPPTQRQLNPFEQLALDDERDGTTVEEVE